MGMKEAFDPRSLMSRIMWYALGCSVALIGSWLFGHETGWTLVQMAALYLVILVPLSEWNYRRRARTTESQDD